MEIGKLIVDILKKKGEVMASDIVNRTGFSRAYINRFFQALQNEGKIILVGKANKARYILATPQAASRIKADLLNIHRILQSKNLSEDVVLVDIKKNSGIFLGLSKNVSAIVDYAFSEMLNNAIEHSRSRLIEIMLKRDMDKVSFAVIDKGIGIFNNIMQKRNVHSEIEAIQDLLKGKQSTAPKVHSGEGIFFTSKVGDILTIQSSVKKLIFNNLLKDIFIKDVKHTVGTKVNFAVSLNSKVRLNRLFKAYTDNSFEFSRTKVTVKLYKMGSEYISRSQARRIVTGLEKFKTIILDFKEIKTVGQGFADEIFRVWKNSHPHIDIIVKNANENVEFMINRARAP